MDEALHIVWSRVWGASIPLHRGESGVAGAELAAVAALADQVGELPAQIARLGFLALGEWREGRHDAALEHATRSLNLMKRTEWLTAPHAYDGFAATTRVWLAALERSRSEPIGASHKRSNAALIEPAAR